MTNYGAACGHFSSFLSGTLGGMTIGLAHELAKLSNCSIGFGSAISRSPLTSDPRCLGLNMSFMRQVAMMF